MLSGMQMNNNKKLRSPEVRNNYANDDTNSFAG